MSDTTYYELSFLACDKDTILKHLPSKEHDALQDYDDATVTDVGNNDTPIMVQHYEYYERTGRDECSLMNAIAEMRIPVTLTDGGIFCVEKPLVRHARIREDGEFVRSEYHPEIENKVDTKKVLEAYMLGQIDKLVHTLNYNNNSWPAQMAILKKLGLR